MLNLQQVNFNVSIFLSTRETISPFSLFLVDEGYGDSTLGGDAETGAAVFTGNPFAESRVEHTGFNGSHVGIPLDVGIVEVDSGVVGVRIVTKVTFSDVSAELDSNTFSNGDGAAETETLVELRSAVFYTVVKISVVGVQAVDVVGTGQGEAVLGEYRGRNQCDRQQGDHDFQNSAHCVLPP